MVVFRFIGLVLIVGALMALGYDAVTSLSSPDGALSMTSLDQLWAMWHSASLESFKSWLTGTLGQSGSDIVMMVLSWPAWIVLGALGILITLLSRPRGG